MNLQPELLQKYNKQGPRYTSYPPATFFTNEYTDDAYRNQLLQSNESGTKNISLYFHIPFCNKLCHFCGCNSIGKPTQEDLVDAYVDAMIKETKNVAALLSSDRKVTQIHWGGGTPHSIQERQIEKIMNTVSEYFNIATDVEIAMECNPAYTELSFFDFLKNLGFNRISLGIQDFDPEVLKSVNRDASLLPVETIVKHLHTLGMTVNFDLIYGLPGQTIEHFFASIEKTLATGPDRIATFSYAHVPWVKKAQAYLEQFKMPQAEEKFMMLLKAYDIFTSSGYKAIGMDHFALQDDELYVAQINKGLHRNFQGYTTKKRSGQVYAFGVSGISQMTDSYAQNVKTINEYIKRITDTGFAVERGYILSKDEKLIREVITEIMCNKFVDFSDVANLYDISMPELKQIVNFNENDLSEFCNDGLLTFNDKSVQVTETGSFFIRNVAMLFDPQLDKKQGMYSRTV